MESVTTTRAESNGAEKQTLIEVKGLKKYYEVRGGIFQHVLAHVKAVDGVSFEIHEGETLGLVGESGCGKTTLGRTLLQLVEASGGEIVYRGESVTDAPSEHLKELRQKMQIIFQDPFTSLDPRSTIAESIAEGLEIHGMGDRKERLRIVLDTLEEVGLAREYADRYPHEFSGGQRQRIGIARALVMDPDFIVCDEPVSALDVSIQSQVLNLLKRLQRERGLTYLFVAHDLSVVEHISDRIAVMYLGKIVELTEQEELFKRPLHPYTQALISAIPIPDPSVERHRVMLEGDVPSPLNPPPGCRFHTRCPIAIDKCKTVEPEFREVTKGHFAACHLAEDSLESPAIYQATT